MLVLCSYCAGTVLVLIWYCTGTSTGLVLNWYCTATGLVLYWCCTNPKLPQDLVLLVLNLYCTGTILVPYCCWVTGVLVLCIPRKYWYWYDYCSYSVLVTSPMHSWFWHWYCGTVLLLYRYCTATGLVLCRCCMNSWCRGPVLTKMGSHEVICS